ncbi:MAG: RNA 2',3'-cyclic phosphodiesterase [Azonexus sp.]|nr:RNA 2',3'-cyclic phosphodiesterase [Azonexus sp.]MDZ4313773.1 RNA 2',3'-cyclic phosphodiesterase [Azonexus sp.]
MSPEGGAEQKIKPPTARVFFALWPSPVLASALADVAIAAAQRYGGRSSRADTMHLTLAFLGEVPEAALPTLCALATEIKAPPFELVIDRLGFWPHNQLFWAGCSTTPAPLQNMALALQNSLIAAGFTPDRADRRFTPHLTLLRKVPFISQPGRDDPLPNISPLPWLCSRWVLVRSRSNAQGPSYQVIGEFLLA